MSDDWDAWADSLADTEPTPDLTAACARLGHMLAVTTPDN